MLRRAREAAERIGLELRFSNESLESQAAYLSSLVDTAVAAAKRAEEAKNQLEREIMERRELEARLRLMATTDGLTGTLNRAETMAQGQQEVERARHHGHKVAVLMLDADHFKAINDQYGHHAGDIVLRTLAGTVTRNIRRVDVFGRVGGEEFVLVMPCVTRHAALTAADRLRQAIAGSPAQTARGPVRVTVSIGLAMFKREDSSLEQTLAQADMALYAAKRDGRNRVACAA
jgi:diguanylate cyclase (GGDEF)-like protein